MSNRAISRLNRMGVGSNVLLCLLPIALLLLPRVAKSKVSATDSIGFFTNLSARLLQQELGLNLNWIQVYPTNQYTPAVHRLLQVAANLWDIQTNRQDAFGPLPTVFAPRFTVSNNAVFITGYGEVRTTNDLSAAPPLDLRWHSGTNLASIVTNDSLIFGVPLVIGARKGLPNFNEYSMESVFTLSRKVELIKSSPGGQSKIIGTNQLFVLSCSIASGVEFWNSYASNYARPVEILVNFRVTMSLTNDLGSTVTETSVTAGNMLITALGTNRWGGWKDFVPDNDSFVVPLRTHITFVPTIGYLPSTGTFVSASNPVYDSDQRLLFPRWFLSVTSWIQAMVVDSATKEIVDYVLLGDMNSHLDVAAEIGQDPNAGDPSNPFRKLWGTNAIGALLSGRAGVIQQIQASKGSFSGTILDWIDEGSFIGNRPLEIAKFKAFFTPDHQATYIENGTTYKGSNGTLRAYAPYTPSVTMTVPMSWQANDPLVHYLVTDMHYDEGLAQVRRIKPAGTTNFPVIKNIGVKNKRYKPWATDPTAIYEDPEAFNLAIKDPLVRSSDDWQFPTNACSTFGQLGQIHRGTPWQTIYLKSPDANLFTWQNWTGNRDMSDAERTLPVRDWSLADLIAPLINTNHPNQLLSVNDSDSNAWLGVLHGLSVLTNSSSDGQLLLNSSVQLDPLIVSSNSSQAGNVVASIFATRASQPDGVFRELGDLLGSPALSAASPWLNQSSSIQVQRGISDEAYERIPAQLLSLVRADSIGAISQNAGVCRIQFTGVDNYPYAVEGSTNLINWFLVNTNYPTNGVFAFTNPPAATSQFYRSRLLP